MPLDRAEWDFFGIKPKINSKNFKTASEKNNVKIKGVLLIGSHFKKKHAKAYTKEQTEEHANLPKQLSIQLYVSSTQFYMPVVKGWWNQPHLHQVADLQRKLASHNSTLSKYSLFDHNPPYQEQLPFQNTYDSLRVVKGQFQQKIIEFDRLMEEHNQIPLRNKAMRSKGDSYIRDAISTKINNVILEIDEVLLKRDGRSSLYAGYPSRQQVNWLSKQKELKGINEEKLLEEQIDILQQLVAQCRRNDAKIN